MNRSPKPPLLERALPAFGFLAVAGLITVVPMVGMGTGEQSDRTAFDAAPICTGTDVTGCRYDAQARVVGTHLAYQAVAVDLALDLLGGKIITADLDQSDRTQWQAWETDAQLPVEVWRNQVVAVAGLKTQENPDTFPVAGFFIAAIASAAIAVAMGALFAWRFVLYRRVVHYRETVLTGADPDIKVLPLTREMSVWLLQLAQAGKSYRRDLDRGVFLRASGRYDIDVTRMKYRGIVEVVSVGGRSLVPVKSESLRCLYPGTGAVDYLPFSGEVVAIHDESGKVLWDRLEILQSQVAETAPQQA